MYNKKFPLIHFYDACKRFATRNAYIFYFSEFIKQKYLQIVETTYSIISFYEKLFLVYFVKSKFIFMLQGKHHYSSIISSLTLPSHGMFQLITYISHKIYLKVHRQTKDLIGLILICIVISCNALILQIFRARMKH